MLQLIGGMLLLFAMFLVAGGAVPSVRGTLGNFALYLAILLAPTGIALLIVGATQPAVAVPTYVLACGATLVVVCLGGLLFILRRIR